jgi:quercetin dioxygenase-like cupin family protein
MYTAAGQQMMLSLVELQPNAVIKSHSHPHEQMGMLLEGEIQLTVAGQSHNVRPGQMWRIPGDVEHSVTAGGQGAKALDVFHPVREDYR